MKGTQQRISFPSVKQESERVLSLEGGVAETPIADERVVLKDMGGSLSGLIDQVARVFAGALGELLGDAVPAEGSRGPIRSNPLDRRIDLYRRTAASLVEASGANVREPRR